uniref:Protein MCM10 homolog n=1 Tax=Biomphalaria glabrata TaxID=6526 RepID=A0A2C9JXH3_BIOGL
MIRYIIQASTLPLALTSTGSRVVSRQYQYDTIDTDMERKMASEDEFCDQETIEALFDAEMEGESTSDKTESCLESLQDFLNADSDSSDEDNDKAGDMKTGVACSGESEILASLIEDDVKETSVLGCRGKAISCLTENISGATETKTSVTMALSGKSSVIKPESGDKEKGKASKVKVSKSKVKTSAPKLVQKESTATSNEIKPEPSQVKPLMPGIMSTQSIQEEMLKMQVKMLELQRMLEMQQSQLTPVQCDERMSSAASTQLSTSPSETQSSKKTSSTNITTEKAIGDTGNNNQLKLLSDDDPCFLTQTSQTAKNQKALPLKRAAPMPKSKPSKMEAELFGDSDSDWEGLDGGDKRNLSEAGRDIKRIMHSSEKKREAHQPKFELSEPLGAKSTSWRSTCKVEAEEQRYVNKMPDKKEKVEKNVLQCKTSSTSQAQAAAPVAESEKVYVDEFSKIRIVNPLISSSLMKMRMEGRKLVGVSKIHLKLKTPDLQGDWVTIAVIVGKTDAKSSSSGKPYCIWKLNDLEDHENSVSFFLFGEVHKHLWKTDLGTVVGVLNPSIMESMEKNNSEPAFTIKNANQLMIMGRSKDLGWCAARTKTGNKCVKFINKKYGEFCSYHVAAAYRKVSSKRLELHGSVNGIKPKSFEKKVFAKDCAYIYGGNTYVPNSSQKEKKNGITLKKLQQNLLGQGKQQKVNTLTISDIKSEPTSVKPSVHDDKAIFMDLISIPSPGSMNLVAYLKKNEGKPGTTSTPLPSKAVESITAKDLIKQHRQVMQRKLAEKKKASEILLASGQVSSSATAVESITDPLKEIPKLGKGFYSGQQISLDVKSRTLTVADRTKNIESESLFLIFSASMPSVFFTAFGSSTLRPPLLLMVARAFNYKNLPSSTSSLSLPGNKAAEPPKKKPRLLGNVDLNSEEVKKILKAKSKHKGALAEAEAEREEVYFNELEKKERMEEKLQTVTSIEITVVTCKQCHYTAQSALDSCKKENHTLVSSKAKKRFFVCKKCKHRTHVIGEKFPTAACSKCGVVSYEKTSMYKIREGPKLESEVLNIRGDEIKFLNSLDNKVFLNTVIDQ